MTCGAFLCQLFAGGRIGTCEKRHDRLGALVSRGRDGDGVAFRHLDDISVLLELAVRHENFRQFHTCHQQQSGDKHARKQLIQTKFVHANFSRERGSSPRLSDGRPTRGPPNAHFLAKLPATLKPPISLFAPFA